MSVYGSRANLYRPNRHLQRYDNPPVVHERRANTSQDHCWTYTIREIDPKHETFDQAQQPERVALAQTLLYVLSFLKLYLQFLRFICSQSKKGPLSSAPSVIFAFLNAKTFASNQEIDQWKREVQITASAAPQGSKKRFEKQTEWFMNDSSVEGECVLDLIPRAEDRELI